MQAGGASPPQTPLNSGGLRPPDPLNSGGLRPPDPLNSGGLRPPDPLQILRGLRPLKLPRWALRALIGPYGPYREGPIVLSWDPGPGPGPLSFVVGPGPP